MSEGLRTQGDMGRGLTSTRMSHEITVNYTEEEYIKRNEIVIAHLEARKKKTGLGYAISASNPDMMALLLRSWSKVMRSKDEEE